VNALVVDDSKPVRSILVRFLPDLGFKCHEAADGQEALDQLPRMARPDLVTINLHMPVMDGLEFAKELRKLPGGNKVVVVFCTTENDVPHIRQALDAGADEYIMKPFDSEIVRSKLLLLGLLG